MANDGYITVLKAAWEALGRGEFDAVAAPYSNYMRFVIPGQNDVLRGKAAFRAALDRIGEALPPGFKITRLRYFGGENDGEVMNLVDWTSTKIPNGTQSAVLWTFSGAGEISEERWFIDTEQWKAAF